MLPQGAVVAAMLKTTFGAVALAVAVVTTTLASAASFQRFVDANGDVWISISGSIEIGDFEKYDRFLWTGVRDMDLVRGFTLNSPGGNIAEAVRIATAIKIIRGVNTFVGEHQECASACFLLWAAGGTRFASPTATIGVHSASLAGIENTSSLAMTTLLGRQAR